ncbi:MAG: hypothetical protein HYS04_10210 [Acidobacteria bacterium]|nr:hypothetical protein [Acidobacteriota bacterium]
MSEPETSDQPVDDGLIRLADADAPIYRIFPLWFLEEALRLRQLALVAPSKWEDPFEVVGDAIAVDIPRGNRIEQVIINQSLPPAFAQCWSRTVESDSLFRAYSRVVKDPHFRRNICPRDEGVRVRSSHRKLLRAVRSGNPSGLNGQWFVGAVMYLSREALLQEIANAIDRHGLQVFEVPSNRAKLLLLKREAFSHEAEVRVIYVQQNQEPRETSIRVPIEPSAVFDETSFDPRLETFERREREAVIRSLGYEGAITDSDLYQRTLLQVHLVDKDNTGSDPSAA